MSNNTTNTTILYRIHTFHRTAYICHKVCIMQVISQSQLNYILQSPGQHSIFIATDFWFLLPISGFCYRFLVFATDFLNGLSLARQTSGSQQLQYSQYVLAVLLVARSSSSSSSSRSSQQQYLVASSSTQQAVVVVASSTEND